MNAFSLAPKGIPSGEPTKSNGIDGHRNSGFSQLQNGGSFHGKMLVHQRVYPNILWICQKSCTSWELLGTYETLEISWDYNGINHLLTGAGFPPSTVSQHCNVGTSWNISSSLVLDATAAVSTPKGWLWFIFPARHVGCSLTCQGSFGTVYLVQNKEDPSQCPLGRCEIS